MKTESKPIRVSFDFDGTLSRPDVQAYAKELIEDGVFEVVVTTSRFDDENAYKHNASPTNEDLYEVTDEVGIKRENIYFTNMEDKVNYLQDDITWHLDDDEHELSEIYKSELSTESINVNDDDWRWNCSFSMIPDYWKSKYQKKTINSIRIMKIREFIQRTAAGLRNMDNPPDFLMISAEHVFENDWEEDSLCGIPIIKGFIPMHEGYGGDYYPITPCFKSLPKGKVFSEVALFQRGFYDYDV